MHIIELLIAYSSV